jgi:hypothetical protein
MTLALLWAAQVVAIGIALGHEYLPPGVALQISFANKFRKTAMLRRLVREEAALFEFVATGNTGCVSSQEKSSFAILI